MTLLSATSHHAVWRSTIQKITGSDSSCAKFLVKMLKIGLLQIVLLAILCHTHVISVNVTKVYPVYSVSANQTNYESIQKYFGIIRNSTLNPHQGNETNAPKHTVVSETTENSKRSSLQQSTPLVEKTEHPIINPQYVEIGGFRPFIPNAIDFSKEDRVESVSYFKPDKYEHRKNVSRIKPNKPVKFETFFSPSIDNRPPYTGIPEYEHTTRTKTSQEKPYFVNELSNRRIFFQPDKEYDSINVGIEPRTPQHSKAGIESSITKYAEGEPFDEYPEEVTQTTGAEIYIHTSPVSAEKGHKKGVWTKNLNSLLPLVLLLAAIPPNTLAANSTQIPNGEKELKNVDKKRLQDALYYITKNFGVEPSESYPCNKRFLCEMAIRGLLPNATLLQYGATVLFSRSMHSVHQQLEVIDVANAVAERKCKSSFMCLEPLSLPSDINHFRWSESSSKTPEDNYGKDSVELMRQRQTSNNNDKEEEDWIIMKEPRANGPQKDDLL